MSGQEIYEKFAPRWFKVIRWREFAERVVIRQKFLVFSVYTPLLIIFYMLDNPYPKELARHRPKTEAERMELRRDFHGNPYVRNFQVDQYTGDQPPKYDLYERRRKYPQYYGDKYENTFKKDGGGIL